MLLAILAVTAAGIVLMRQNVMHSFAQYAVNIELDRLQELSDSLRTQYRTHRDWRFVPIEADARTRWLAAELIRLQELRALPAPPTPPAAPAPASTIAPPAAPAPPQIARAPIPAQASAKPVPAVPAVPALPALPPLPLPPLIPVTAPLPPSSPVALEASGIDQLALQDRITLFARDDRYLAGRAPDATPGARRAIVDGAQTLGFLFVAQAQRPSDAMAGAFLQQQSDSLLIIIVVSIALSALAAVLLAAHFRKPILRLTAGARALAEGRFDTRLDAARSDELGTLAQCFNQLASRLAMAEESRRQWVADTSHELRTPLSVLRAQMEAIQDGVRPPSPEHVATMLRQVLALNKLIDELYELARADVGELAYQKRRLNLWDLALEQSVGFGEKLRAAGLAFEAGPAPAHATVLADPDRMGQVFANLFENCVRYSARGGRVVARAREAAGELTITIDDSAPGVPEAALARLAERFFRVDASRDRQRGGAGLGLALCMRIVLAHHGRLEFSHAALGGLRVSLTLKLETP